MKWRDESSTRKGKKDLSQQPPGSVKFLYYLLWLASRFPFRSGMPSTGGELRTRFRRSLDSGRYSAFGSECSAGCGVALRLGVELTEFEILAIEGVRRICCDTSACCRVFSALFGFSRFNCPSLQCIELYALYWTVTCFKIREYF